ncbi:hypothetical protein MVEN_01172900 [Mycena venus]|uniref:Uncharacterized protein n=1 Tax=Mycena venus TaxID=2733690 RepID=A0A8H6Y535_9AGAR|nr:hypothetical protein MVEN_01172900 [Mycena venus]
MLGFTAILSASLSLLLASQSVLAVASPALRSPRSHLLSIRQDSSGQFPIVSQCKTQCTTMETSLNNAASAGAAEICTSAIMSQIEACYDCEAKAGAETIQFFQDDVNTVVADCAQLGKPVKGFTVVAKNAGERLSLGISGSVVVGLAALSLVVL